MITERLSLPFLIALDWLGRKIDQRTMLRNQARINRRMRPDVPTPAETIALCAAWRRAFAQGAGSSAMEPVRDGRGMTALVDYLYAEPDVVEASVFDREGRTVKKWRGLPDWVGL